MCHGVGNFCIGPDPGRVYLDLVHTLQSTELGSLQFAVLASRFFKNQIGGGHKDARYTAPQCVEQFVSNGKLPLRAVLCVRAYRKFPELYDFTLLTASTDDVGDGLHVHRNHGCVL